MKFSAQVLSIAAASAVVVDAGWVYPQRGWNAISNTLPGATFKKRDALPEPVPEPEPEVENELEVRAYGGYYGDVYAACGYKNMASKYNKYPINGYAYAAAIVQAIPVPKDTPSGAATGAGAGAATPQQGAGSGAGAGAGGGGSGSGAGAGTGSNPGSGSGAGDGSAGDQPIIPPSGSSSAASSGSDGSGLPIPDPIGGGNTGGGQPQADAGASASVGPAAISDPISQRYVAASSAYDCCAQAFKDPNSLFFFYTSNQKGFDGAKCTIVSNSKCPIPGGEAIVLAASFNATAPKGTTYGNYIGNGKCGSGVKYAFNNANAAVCAANSAGIRSSNKSGGGSAANGAAAACAYTSPQTPDQGGVNPVEGGGVATGSTKRSFRFE